MDAAGPSLNTLPFSLLAHIDGFLTPNDKRRLKTVSLPVHNHLRPICPAPPAHTRSAPTHMLSVPRVIEIPKERTYILRLILLPHTLGEKITMIFGSIISSLIQVIPLLREILFIPMYVRRLVDPSGGAENKIHMFALSLFTIFGYTYAASKIYVNTQSFFLKGIAHGIHYTILSFYGAGTINGGMLGFFHLKGTLQNLVVGDATEKYPLVFKSRDQNTPSRLLSRWPRYKAMGQIISQKSDKVFAAAYFISNIAVTILTGNPILACAASETIGCLAKVFTMKLLAEKHQYDWIH